MKKNNKLEIILYSRYSLTDSQQKELVKWLGTLQSVIGDQHEKSKRLFLKALSETSAIYLS
jgi:hypothetical protein